MITAVSTALSVVQAQTARAATASSPAFTLSEAETAPEPSQDRAGSGQSSRMQEALLQARAAEANQTEAPVPAAKEGAAASEAGAEAAPAGAASAGSDHMAPAGTRAAGDAAPEKQETSDADRKKAARKAAKEIEESFDRIKELLANRTEVPEAATGSQAAASAWAASRKVLGISSLPSATASVSATSA